MITSGLKLARSSTLSPLEDALHPLTLITAEGHKSPFSISAVMHFLCRGVCYLCC